jgi:hypothetical protein
MHPPLGVVCGGGVECVVVVGGGLECVVVGGGVECVVVGGGVEWVVVGGGAAGGGVDCVTGGGGAAACALTGIELEGLWCEDAFLAWPLRALPFARLAGLGAAATLVVRGGAVAVVREVEDEDAAPHPAPIRDRMISPAVEETIGLLAILVIRTRSLRIPSPRFILAPGAPGGADST